MTIESGSTEGSPTEEVHVPDHRRLGRGARRHASGWKERRGAIRFPAPAASRLVVASNRLPVALAKGQGDECEWSAHPASGGLVTALSPVTRRRGGIWVGWPGVPEVGEVELHRALNEGGMEVPHELRAVSLSEAERDRFYYGFCNGVLWPLFHGFPEHRTADAAQWDAYADVNRRFARVLADVVAPGDLIWVHDYQLMLVARELRRLGVPNRTAFFLHIPFPAPGLLSDLPEHRHLVRALLDFGLVGFQSPRDRNHFEAAARLVGGGWRAAPVPAPAAPAGWGGPPGRSRTGVFPISIDFEEFSAGAKSAEVTALGCEIRRRVGERTLILGVDRLDYTKGIPERLRGLDQALEEYPALRGRIVLEQLVVPSREAVSAYWATKVRIEKLVAEVNARWGREDWLPVHYHYGSWTRPQLLAHYRSADVALVTPLKDGMNLVAKEFCAANGGSGVLILSAFAGAAAELGSGALLVDPGDPRRVADAIHTAHAMPLDERTERMTLMKEAVRTNHVHRWVETFLTHAVRGSRPVGGGPMIAPDPQLLPQRPA